ncbi:MAG: hypothetical protein JWR18_236 [Segetibacter sp.]|jgi:hypothetical protein|nr:hypothetical protein [Segetibacter sp.]
MKNRYQIQLKKITIALLLVGATHIAMGSFTGSTDKRTKNIYSLKNFNRNFYKSVSPFSLRSGFEYKGLQLLSQKKEVNGDITYNSMMRFEKGNTTYIYPYTHKVSVPKFKAPTPPTFR